MAKRSALKGSRSRKMRCVMLKEGTGFLALMLGAMGGDSENLIFPIALILIGAWMVLTSKDN